MRKKRKPLKWTFLVLLGLTIIFSFLGLIIETLFTLNIVQTDIAPIRNLGPISTILTLAFITSGTIVWWKLFKEKKQTLLWWHILIAISLLTVFYKYIEPTALRILIPNYFMTMPITLIIIWAIGFTYLRKSRL